MSRRLQAFAATVDSVNGDRFEVKQVLRRARLQDEPSDKGVAYDRKACSHSGLRAWVPAILWAGFIFLMSTSYFSAANTGRIIEPIIRWLWPGISVPTLGLIHAAIRKLAHFTEYGIFCLILLVGPLCSKPVIAVLLCGGYGLSDEFHQIFVPGRTPALHDVAVDLSGAAFIALIRASIAYLPRFDFSRTRPSA